MKMNAQEMNGGTISYDFQADGLAKGARRMKLLCAGEKEQALYKYSPNAARDNERPGQPFDQDSTPPYSE